MDLSIVVPVYNSENCLEQLVKQIHSDLSSKYPQYELILVNDCSPDKSWEKIISLARKHSYIKGLNLRKNVGQDNAVMAGLNKATGKIIITMDDDLQHNPKDIPLLVSKIENGDDVCFAHFKQKKQALWKNIGSWFNGIIGSLLLKKPKDLYMSPFKAMSQGLVKDVIKYDGPFPYVNGLCLSCTSRISQVIIEHHQSIRGKSNYNLVRSISVWLKLFTSFSVVPLRFFSLIGMIVSIISFCFAIYYILYYFFIGINVRGWTFMMVSIFFLAGVQLMGIGLLGEYIGRTYLKINNRLQFSIKEMTGGQEN